MACAVARGMLRRADRVCHTTIILGLEKTSSSSSSPFASLDSALSLWLWLCSQLWPWDGRLDWDWAGPSCPPPVTITAWSRGNTTFLVVVVVVVVVVMVVGALCAGGRSYQRRRGINDNCFFCVVIFGVVCSTFLRDYNMVV